ncbi:MAG: acetate--CoA ligase family protein [Candidatus Delongbacteria bacterium]|nr:acetate--CoA ligase family protein [Candidatus Delongbacteria bacterium]
MVLTTDRVDAVNRIFEEAEREERRVLFEYEVYRILQILGFDIPRYLIVQEGEPIRSDMLDSLGSKIVLKVISAEILHKQKIGGVCFLDHPTPDTVEARIRAMRSEVVSHFPADHPPAIRGYMMVEFIPYSQALGYETLIGFKHDPAFGSILTLSKGGDDAEFFAKYYDPVDLFIPPLDMDQTRLHLSTLKIRHKFNQIGHPEFLDYLATAVCKMSGLAYAYSPNRDKLPAYLIQSFEINPFVFTRDNRMVAIDGLAQFIPLKDSSIQHPPLNVNRLDGFFNPTGIAVIGVSSNPGQHSLGRDIANLLHDMKRTDLYLVNIKGGETTVGGQVYPLYRDINEIDHPVDLVVYTAPAIHTIDFFKNLNKESVKAVVLISGIPSNIHYQDFAGQLRESVGPGIRIIGPNCMGVFYAPGDHNPGVNTLFIEEKRLEVRYAPTSNTVLLTQSGALAVTEIDKLQNTRIFKAIVSFGNKYDVKITDLVDYFAHDPSIDVLSLYVEGFDPGEGRLFFELAGKITKPIIVYKSGRTEAGARAAASHTASMSGSYDVFKAACLQSGSILAENIEDHYDLVKIFALLAHRIPEGHRVAGVVNAGFESTVGADELKNLIQARLTPATIETLNRINRSGLVDTSTAFLDITPMADDRMYADYVEAILQDENVDCIFVAIVPHTVTLKTTPETCRDPDGLAGLLIQLSRRYAKPIVISVNAGKHYQAFVSLLEENGLPVYHDIRSAIKSLDGFVTHHLKSIIKSIG